MTCRGAGTGTEGGACNLTEDCAEDLFCGIARTCEPAGDVPVDGVCQTTSDCEAGLSCNFAGFLARCREGGTGDVGADCTSSSDCLAGLSCVGTTPETKICISPVAAEPGTPTVPDIPFWAGPECPADEETPTAYFTVPRFAGSDGDFYRLPFPNDVRRTTGGVDMRGHPSPETAVEVDIMDRYLRAMEDDLTGFATNPVIYFRFSEPYDWDTVGGSLRLVNVDPDSPRFGQERALAWLTTFGAIGKYICENWLGVRTPHGDPLEHDTTYALIMTSQVRPEAGGTYARQADLANLLGDATPSDSALASAYDSYGPLPRLRVGHGRHHPRRHPQRDGLHHPARGPHGGAAPGGAGRGRALGQRPDPLRGRRDLALRRRQRPALLRSRQRRLRGDPRTHLPAHLPGGHPAIPGARGRWRLRLLRERGPDGAAHRRRLLRADRPQGRHHARRGLAAADRGARHRRLLQDRRERPSRVR